jgi:competence protein ComEA
VPDRTTLGTLGALVAGLALAALAARPLPAAPPTPPAAGPAREAARAGRGEGAAAPEIRALRDGGKLDPNRATAAELELLPGIGPTLAARIVEDRARRGPFPSVEALGRVSGIGARRLADLRPLVSVAPGTQSAESTIEEPDHAGDEREARRIRVEGSR